MNTPVSFEIAKLLKEKGFNEPKNTMYCRSIPMFGNDHVIKFHDGNKHQCSNIPHDWNNTQILIKSTSYYSAPTIAEVVYWIYSKYDIWISLIPDSLSGHKLLDRKFSVSIFRFNMNLNVQAEILRKDKNILYFNLPENAFEYAIEYILNTYKPTS